MDEPQRPIEVDLEDGVENNEHHDIESSGINSVLGDCFCPQSTSTVPTTKDVAFPLTRGPTDETGHEKDMLDHIFEPVEAAMCGHQAAAVDAGGFSVDRGGLQRANSLLDDESTTSSEARAFQSMKERLNSTSRAGSVHSTEMADVTLTEEEKERMQQERKARNRCRAAVAVLVCLVFALVPIVGLRFLLGKDGDDHAPLTDSLESACAQAINVPSNEEFSVVDTNPEASFALDDAVASCYDPVNSGNGKMFTLVGDDQTYRASTCNDDGAGVGTKIAVFRDSCESLQCVAVSANATNDCGDQSDVTWLAENDVAYHIYVYRFRAKQGAYSLIVAPLKDESQV